MIKLLLLLFLPLFAHASTITVKTDNPEKPTIEITEESGLALASRMLAAEDYRNARVILNHLAESSNAEVRREALFMIGMSFISQNDPRWAIKFFIMVLAEDPMATRARLELGKAYFMNREFDLAAENFRMALGDRDLPPEVAKQVEDMIALARKNRNWNAHFGFGLVPDSNLNATPGDNYDCIMTIFGPMQCEKRQTGVGTRINTGFNHYLRFTDTFGLRTTVQFQGTAYEQSKFNDYILFFATGPRFIFKGSELSVQPTISRRWIGGEALLTNTGLRADYSADVAKQWFLMTGVSATKAEYDDYWLNATYGGWSYATYVRPRYMINQRSFVGAEFGYSRDDLRTGWNSSDSFTYGLDYFIETRSKFGFALSVAQTEMFFDAKHNYMVLPYGQSDEQFEQCVEISSLVYECYMRRRDTINTFSASVISNESNWLGIYPSLRYSYLKRDSNIPMRTYDSHRIEILGTYRF
ncbi:MAG: surface lipoprotein assembly modifier [Alphaproteobacteria bacterium]|nr:surface lipoprotein assembly modifier [Alphaproteobacteria bacterium]